jgi:hypothetical protein
MFFKSYNLHHQQANHSTSHDKFIYFVQIFLLAGMASAKPSTYKHCFGELIQIKEK